MKPILLALSLVAASPLFAGGGGKDKEDKQTDLRKIDNTAFKRGEVLKYRVHYGAIDAGEAVISVEQENKQIAGRNTYHVVGKGSSKGAFDWFFKVRDTYESYIDESAIVPWMFVRRVDEGGFKITQNMVFDHYHGRVNSNGSTMDVPINIQDMISAFYYARTIDMSNIKAGDILEVPCFVDDKQWTLKIKYVGRETIKSDVGKVKCMKFRPVVQTGRIFKKEEDLNVWISDDKNRIPVRAQANILVGSIKMDLQSYSGLASTLAIAP